MKADALVQFKLMLPAGLKTRVEASADRNRRSLSQEIVWALEERYPAPIEESRKVTLQRLFDHLCAYPDSEQVVEVSGKILHALKDEGRTLTESELNALLVEALGAVQAHEQANKSSRTK
ncbi:hypothetical protein [Roseinatronobacter bogoriensis]|uniref:Arc-like DNA binding domain-containing protein n=1 Tax=Roseinatronobacter bogoriensis subsp. barguzinensis TaxID=441209 RepID=A0A2K8KDA8_9RHOB|nr:MULTISPECIES: hypothetical protein [Rhodobaca]ATX64728.1 hypothetical protein BG454_01840 [Rhodobaca barguzinensis]